MKEKEIMQESKKKITQVQESLKVDSETGEILNRDVKVVSTQVSQEPNYVKLYLQDILYLNRLSTSHHNVLFSIITRMDYNNKIVLVKNIKEDIAKECGVVVGTISQAIKELHKEEIIIRVAQGVYIVNPVFFGKGKWENIKQLRMTIKLDYSNYGRTFSTYIQETLPFDEHDTSEAV